MAGQESEEKKNIKYIENPLPGPRPHVKKEMTYDYEVPENKMFFDIDTPRDNYYDIS